MSMVDVQGANIHLPLEREGEPIRNARIRWAVRWEKTPTFDELVSDRAFFWEEFCYMTHTQLMQRCAVLDIPYRLKDPKRLLVAKLVGYWRERLELTSKGKWSA